MAYVIIPNFYTFYVKKIKNHFHNNYIWPLSRFLSRLCSVTLFAQFLVKIFSCVKIRRVSWYRTQKSESMKNAMVRVLIAYRWMTRIGIPTRVTVANCCGCDKFDDVCNLFLRHKEKKLHASQKPRFFLKKNDFFSSENCRRCVLRQYRL